MNKEEIDKVLEELNQVNPSQLNDEALRLFNAIMSIADERDLYKTRINKAIEYIKNKLSTDTYQHLKEIYNDIDKTEYVWEEYEFEDLLEILKGDSNE